jgi:octaprenyl-diphosphate synthase
VSRVLSGETETSVGISQIYEPIRAELEQVEETLRSELRSPFGYVDELVRYGCLLGGKRLRPVLLLLSGKAVGRTNQDHIRLAAVIEMIHTATLVHDDVLDEADTRRHLATVNSRWDAKTSVLLGDFLFTHAFHLASQLDSTFACRVIGRATNIVCEGELRQKGTQADFSLTESEYLGIVAAKTAELCACSCLLGAHTAGADEHGVRQLEDYGRDLGIAFQIVDDLLDLGGDESSVGKSLGSDLDQLKPTLPLIRLLQVTNRSDRRAVLSILNGEADNRERALRPYFDRYGAFSYAYDVAQRYAQRASDRLVELTDSPATRTLRLLSEFVVTRSR